jgi:arylsulfatase A-like enzyme
MTLAEMLKNKQYSTGIFGKWHLGTLTTQETDANRGRKDNVKEYSTPDMHGFDEYFVTESKVPTYNPMTKPIQFNTADGESLRYGWTAIDDPLNQESYGTSYWSGKEIKVKMGLLQGENTAIIMDRVIPFMKKAILKKQPFFTVIWIHTPHLPVVTNNYYKTNYDSLSNEEQLYYGSISAMDEQVGRLTNFLEAEGVSDNTMIWFASDNGPELRTPGSADKFKGKKRDLYEGGLRVPGLLVWPERITESYRATIPAVTSDYLPSIAAVLKLPLKPGLPLDGIPIIEKLINRDNTRGKSIGFQAPGRVSWVSDYFKLVRNGKDAEFELFNLIADPSEENNIISKNTALAITMKADLEKWIESCKESDAGQDYIP